MIQHSVQGLVMVLHGVLAKIQTSGEILLVKQGTLLQNGDFLVLLSGHAQVSLQDSLPLSLMLNRPFTMDCLSPSLKSSSQSMVAEFIDSAVEKGIKPMLVVDLLEATATILQHKQPNPHPFFDFGELTVCLSSAATVNHINTGLIKKTQSVVFSKDLGALKDKEGAAGVKISPVPERVKIGVIDYLVSRPVIDGILQEEKKLSTQFGIDLMRGTPAEINAAMSTGLVAAGGVSSFAFGCNYEDWLLMPNVSVSSHGFIRSVLLFSHYPDWKQLHNSEVAVTDHSATSTALLKLLCKNRYEIEPRFDTTESNLDKMLQNHSAALLIGDVALLEGIKRRAINGHVPYVFDLGMEWHKWMGCPFVLSVWAVRRDKAEQFARSSGPGFLRASKDKGIKSLSRLAQSGANQLGLTPAICEDYLKCFDFELSADHFKGLMAFFRMSIPDFDSNKVAFFNDTNTKAVS